MIFGLPQLQNQAFDILRAYYDNIFDIRFSTNHAVVHSETFTLNYVQTVLIGTPHKNLRLNQLCKSVGQDDGSTKFSTDVKSKREIILNP